MQIIRNKEAATLTFVPVEQGEAEVLNSIIAIAKPEDKMSYGGRGGGKNGEPFVVYLHIGSRREAVVKKSGNVTIHSHEEIGGIKLELRGSGEDNDQEVRCIRDTCFFGAGNPIFLGTAEVDGKTAIVITMKRCKLCNSPMISMVSCEWRTCDACAAKCEHEYERGVVHGGSAGNMGMGEYCGKCGRGKPEPEDARKKDQIERELEVEKELGINVLWKEGPFEGPRHFAEVNRTVRRYRKAKARS